MFAPMMFDSPQSMDNTLTVVLASTVMLCPVVIILSILIAWLLFSKKKNKVSAVIMSIPYLHGLLIIVLFVLLEIYCDGNFAC